MPGVPQGAFAAHKVREQWQMNLMLTEDDTTYSEKMFNHSKTHPMHNALEQPMQYSSKLMNSIWGLYNRYSVHNFKKNTDGKFVFIGECHLSGAIPQPSIAGMLHH